MNTKDTTLQDANKSVDRLPNPRKEGNVFQINGPFATANVLWICLKSMSKNFGVTRL